jgi:hypothetical protein
MSSRYKLLFFFLIITSLPLFSQYRSIIDDLEKNRPGEGKVRIIQDESLKTMLDRETYELKKLKGIGGFRIRIFSGSGPNAKSEFEETKAQFISYYDIPLYERWDSPFYKIYVGDFRTRSEAMKLLNHIEKKFPDAFIVQTKIFFPKLEPNE